MASIHMHVANSAANPNNSAICGWGNFLIWKEKVADSKCPDMFACQT